MPTDAKVKLVTIYSGALLKVSHTRTTNNWIIQADNIIEQLKRITISEVVEKIECLLGTGVNGQGHNAWAPWFDSCQRTCP